MPIDLYKLSGLDYRDKTRESKLGVEADVERARRITEMQNQAAIDQAQKLEGIARQRFVENYSKTVDPNTMPAGLNEAAKESWARQDAESAWNKKVASSDLGAVLEFEKAAGAMPHIRDLAKEKIQADQQDIEVRKEENKSKMMSLISLVGAMVGMGGLGGIGGLGGAGGEGGGLLKSLGETKSSGSELEKIAGDKLKAGGAQSRAAYSLAEKENAENTALLPNAGARVLTQAEQAEKDRALRNQAAQTAVDQGRLELFSWPDVQNLRLQDLEEQIKSRRLQNSIDPTILQQLREAEIEQRKAAAAAANARAGGRSLGIGSPAGQPLTRPKGQLSADELDLNSILR